MKKTDNQQLVTCIEKCFDLSMDGRLSQARQNDMLVLGKRLRGSLINLLTAEFTEELQQIDEANQQIDKVNKMLDKASRAISKIADTVKEINKLATTLDKLLKFAAGFK